MAEVGRVGRSLDLGELGDFGGIWGDFTPRVTTFDPLPRLRQALPSFAALRHSGQSLPKLAKDFEMLHCSHLKWSAKLPVQNSCQ